jgi:hypothetical protein
LVREISVHPRPNSKDKDKSVSEQDAATKIEAMRNKAEAAGGPRWSKVSLELYQVVTQYVAIEAKRGRWKGAKLEIYGRLDPALKGAERKEYKGGGDLAKRYEAIDNAYRKGKKEQAVLESRRTKR